MAAKKKPASGRQSSNKSNQAQASGGKIKIVPLTAKIVLNKLKTHGGPNNNVRSFFAVKAPTTHKFNTNKTKNKVKQTNTPKEWGFKAAGVSADGGILTVMAKRTGNFVATKARATLLIDTLDLDITVTADDPAFSWEGEVSIEYIETTETPIGDFDPDQ